MKYDNRALPIGTVASRLLAHLTQSSGAQAPWRVSSQPTVRQMPWSTIYFFDVDGATTTRQLVVKIPGFPDQTIPETSWESPELLTRGQREYTSMAKVYDHFSSQSNPRLCALKPEAYLRDINAVVMDFISSGTLYDNSIAPRHLATPHGRQTAIARMRATGEWLHWLHTLPAESFSPANTRSPGDAYAELLREAERLRAFAIRPETLPGWETALNILRTAPLDRLVWSHTDFHMRNVYVLPGEKILSIDTALDTLDSPCADLAKMIVDLRTRRIRILTQGLVPPDPIISQLISAFLEGYGSDFHPLTLALYEGQFLLEKWTQVQTPVQPNQRAGAASTLTTLITRLAINPMLRRQVTAWLKRVRSLAS